MRAGEVGGRGGNWGNITVIPYRRYFVNVSSIVKGRRGERKNPSRKGLSKREHMILCRPNFCFRILRSGERMNVCPQPREGTSEQQIDIVIPFTEATGVSKNGLNGSRPFILEKEFNFVRSQYDRNWKQRRIQYNTGGAYCQYFKTGLGINKKEENIATLITGLEKKRGGHGWYVENTGWGRVRDVSVGIPRPPPAAPWFYRSNDF